MCDEIYRAYTGKTIIICSFCLIKILNDDIHINCV